MNSVNQNPEGTLYLRVSDQNHEDFQRITGILIRSLRGKLVIVGRATDIYERLIERGLDVQMVDADSPLPDDAFFLPPWDQMGEFAKSIRNKYLMKAE